MEAHPNTWRAPFYRNGAVPEPCATREVTTEKRPCKEWRLSTTLYTGCSRRLLRRHSVVRLGCLD